jgi:polysaccharide pyruvyl transferase WcaK-like protein
MPPTPPHAPSRRQWLTQATGLSFAALLARAGFAITPLQPARILLASGWQWVNIGDIAQTPGALRLLERIEGAEITLWLVKPTEPITAMVRRKFPRVQIVEGTIDRKTLAVTGDGLKKALGEMDLAIHGSASSLAAPELLAWSQTNKKPFGVMGISVGDVDERQASVLSNARFILTRETSSQTAMKRAGVRGPEIGFFPDASFAFDLRDDATAEAFLKSNGLAAGEFFCVVPRLRYTPFRRFPADELRKRQAINEEFADKDHGKLREAITLAIRKTGKKVLVCPEMTYQLELMDKLVIDPLPDDVKKNVVKRKTFWLPDEAASTYARAAAVVSFELHSPILALAAGTPAIYLHQPTEIHKGQMFRDLRLPQWIQEIDDTTGERIAGPLLEMLTNPAAAKKKATATMELVREHHEQLAMTLVKAMRRQG